MICPKCKGTNSKVVDTRERSLTHWRRRECCSCGYRFNTTEYYVKDALNVGHKKTGAKLHAKQISKRYQSCDDV